jgi:PST family polysaccharide transporter
MQLFLNGIQAIAGYGFCAIVAYLVMLPLGELIYIARLAVGLGGYVAGFAIVVLVWAPFRRSVKAVLKSRSLLR